MQGLFEALLCRRRAWLVAFVACCAIAQIAASATCLAESVAPEPTDHLNGTPKKTPVYIVDETECKAKAYPPRPERGQKPPFGLSEAQLNAVLAWSEPEHWAWDQICQHLNVDFDEKKANEFADQTAAKFSVEHDTSYRDKLKEFRKNNSEHPEKLANDESRRLSGDFLSVIFGTEAFRHHTSSQPLKFFGFRTDRLVIDTAALQSLDIRDAYVDRFAIFNTTVGDLWLKNVHSANIKLNMVTAKSLLLNDVSVAARNSVPAYGWEPNGALEINATRIEDWISIKEGRYDAINLNYLKVGDLFIDRPAWTSSKRTDKPQLSITESVDNGVFTFDVDPQVMPKRIKLNQFTFASAYLGPDPMPVMIAMRADANAEADAAKNKTDAATAPTDAMATADAKLTTSGRPDLEPYTLIAKSYAERGETSASDSVLIAKNNQDRHLASILSLDIVLLTLTWIGLHPGLGLASIAVCVLLGWGIFRYASNCLEEGSYEPKSPFLLALDSVIPVIQLDKRHEEVRYKGWPQKMLYLLRSLGAVLVFLALSYMQKKVLG